MLDLLALYQSERAVERLWLVSVEGSAVWGSMGSNWGKAGREKSKAETDFSSFLPPILIWALYNKSFSVAWKEHCNCNPLSCKSFIKNENTRSSELNWIKHTLLFLEGLSGCHIQGFVSADSWCWFMMCLCARNYWKNKTVKQQINQASQTVVLKSPSTMGEWQDDTVVIQQPWMWSCTFPFLRWTSFYNTKFSVPVSVSQ